MNIEKFLADNKIHPNKKLDQYFLKNDAVMEEEIKLAGLKADDIVLEIGAGFGNLTERVAKRCRTIAVEIDERFLPFLEKIRNVTVVNIDAVKYLKTSTDNFNKTISNIPYSKSQEIMIELLKHKFDVAVLIVQREFAEKLKGNEKLGMLLRDCAIVEIIRNISGNDFYPETVDSSIIKIKQKKIMDDNLWNFLKKIYKDKNKNCRKIIENCPDSLKNKKIHQLTLDEIKTVFTNLQRHKKGKGI